MASDSGPAAVYADISRQVALLSIPAGKGATQAQRAYLIARAALLIQAGIEGSSAAAERAYRLADELATEVLT